MKIPFLSRAPGVFLLPLLCVSTAFAESDFPEVYNSEKDTEANPPSAEEAADLFDLPEGFSIEVFASEPEVRNPVGMAWDGKGRMWVAENYTYAEKSRRFDFSLRDRVLILEDTDGDGVADSRKVFIDDVQPLTSVEVGRGGVWLVCPPQLLFVPDRDGDDVPDGEPEVILDGFEIPKSNYHNFANGLRWGPDRWLYGRCGHSAPGRIGAPGTPDEERVPIEGGIWRYHPDREVFEALTHGTTNPWGHDWDRNGELFFINTVNGHLWHGIPGAHFKEPYGTDPNPYVYERIGMHADHWHFDISGSWMDSREGAANAFGGGHAHIGMMIYQRDEWPEEYHDRLFTINMHGRRTNVERLERQGSGFVGRHEPDIFLAGDEWYRGIDIQPGPDGAVYIIDWSDTGECHEHTGVHRTSGRIYRVHYGDETISGQKRPDSYSEETLAKMRGGHPWFDRQVWAAGDALELTEEVREHFETLALAEDEEVPARLRALWALHGAGKDLPDWEALFASSEEAIRTWTIRLLTDDQPIDTTVGPMRTNLPEALPGEIMNRFVSAAQTDPSGLVRLALASTLQRIPVADRVELGAALAARSEDADDHNLPEMVWFGISPLAESDPAALVEIAGVTDWPDLLRWIGRTMSSGIEEDVEVLNSLLSLVPEASPERQEAILVGVNDGLRGLRQAPEPASWNAVVAAVSGSADTGEELHGLVRELSALFGDGRALDEIKAVALNDEADYVMRKAALKTLIENRPDDLREICESLLDVRHVNTVAVRGLALFDDPELGRMLAKRYRRFFPEERPAVVEVLTSRPEWAMALLEQMEEGEVSRSDLTAFQARQIRSFDDEELSAKLAEVWGKVRESDADKRRQIEEWTAKLTPEVLAEADLPRGRQLYAAICGACHIMYGEGGKIGPDLTGSGRGELEYLLENIYDPNAVVSADYQMTILTLEDGRVLTGVVAEENDRTISLRQATEQSVIAKDEVVKREVSPVSMMPEGLMLAFDEEQVRDVIAYLMHPVQVPLPGEE